MFRIDFSGPVVEADFLPGRVMHKYTQCVVNACALWCVLHAGKHPALQGNCAEDDTRADYVTPWWPDGSWCSCQAISESRANGTMYMWASCWSVLVSMTASLLWQITRRTVQLEAADAFDGMCMCCERFPDDFCYGNAINFYCGNAILPYTVLLPPYKCCMFTCHFRCKWLL